MERVGGGAIAFAIEIVGPDIHPDLAGSIGAHPHVDGGRDGELASKGMSNPT
jgi:hypothetical protein